MKPVWRFVYLQVPFDVLIQHKIMFHPEIENEIEIPVRGYIQPIYQQILNQIKEDYA